MEEMAAISHIRNRKEAKTRENVEHISQKCLTQSGDVCKESFIRLLRCGLKLKLNILFCKMILNCFDQYFQ